jgi:hypothetical protein
MTKTFRQERLLFRDFRITGPRRPRPPTDPGRRRIARYGAMAVAMGTVSFVTLTGFGVTAATAATTPVTLGTATSFAVLAGSTITNSGPSVIVGDIGLSPGTSITGFPPGVQSSGVTHTADTQALSAQTDLGTAYVDAAGRTPFTTVTADLGGSTLTPGVYQSSTSLALTGQVTLNGGGDPNAVFVFQAGSTLTTASSSSVVLTNAAQACNVFWQVGSSATLGTSTNFTGTIMALTSATLNTGASVNGRVLVRSGAVTLNDNAIGVPTCSAQTTTTTTTVPATTTTTVPATTTTTVPATTTTTVPATTTTTVPVTTTTTPSTTTTAGPIIPSGSPQTGFGGTAPSGRSPLAPIGFGALGLAGLFGALAVRARRRQLNAERDSSGD